MGTIYKGAKMTNIDDISFLDNDIDSILIDEFWNFGDKYEALMHKVHAYPAKFPSFIASKAFDYAKQEGVALGNVADVFCGCGTVALEAKARGLNFWGCDINPVATLITKAKSQSYKIDTLLLYYEKIINNLNKEPLGNNLLFKKKERLNYWFDEINYNKLMQLKFAVDTTIPNKSKYKIAFLCIFSSILKHTSKWLSKSIKPQIDPNKVICDPYEIFERKFKIFCKAVGEHVLSNVQTKNNILNKNLLHISDLPLVDLIISSPPYVTSYEYADLHQLSSLWLEYADDYKELRKGSIGSIYNNNAIDINISLLNHTGQNIVQNLIEKQQLSSKTKSIIKYYIDIQKAIIQCFKMLKTNGMIFFVVGDTEYKGIKIENSKHLINSLFEVGFQNIKITKRLISNKCLTPYRDNIGKFTSDKNQRIIYHNEWIITGRKYV